MQEFTGVPSRSTVQAPHSPTEQPCFTPVNCRRSRSTSRSDSRMSISISTARPFTVMQSRFLAVTPAAFLVSTATSRPLHGLGHSALGQHFDQVFPIVLGGAPRRARLGGLHRQARDLLHTFQGDFAVLVIGF